ncbi:MAG: hypothetical protein CMC70_11320, partial [Flavobacteriaceae bacterium]|nr:hypothetical protein [Flavobacteriaceae bacterium]
MKTDQHRDLLARKIRMLGITPHVLSTLRGIHPFVETQMDGIVDRFYAHMQTFPEGRRIFADRAMVAGLKRAQREHWLNLFRGALDTDYVFRAMRVGQVPYERRVAPYIYIAGYNFFQCELLRILSEKYRSDSALPDMLGAITRVISLD